MPSAPLPPDEPARLDVLRACAVLDTPPEEAFDALTRLAARLSGAPVVLVSLVDADRQWFKSRIGMEAAQTPRDASFCTHVVHEGREIVVPDARRDDRFSDNPHVLAGDIRSYAGFPLRSSEGHVLGTLCVADARARAYDDATCEALRTLAHQVAAQLELRRALACIEESFLARLETGVVMAAQIAAERQRIALDLHDGVCQELTGVALGLQSVARRVAGADASLRAEIEGLRHDVETAIEHCRVIAQGEPAFRAGIDGLGVSLEKLCEALAEHHSMRVERAIDAQIEQRLGASAVHEVYWIAREALRSVARRGGARCARIELAWDEDAGLQLRVEDDARSPIEADASSEEAQSLRLARFRAELIGAEFAIERGVPAGRVLRLRLSPVAAARLNRSSVGAGVAAAASERLSARRP